MNSKKLLALLCATAMASSTLVPVISASADETANLSEATVLWSDTFDAYTSDTTGLNKPDINIFVDAVNPRDSYTAIEGLTLYTTNRADDSSYFGPVVVEENDLAIATTISRFSNSSRGAYMQFAETYAPTDEQSLVLSTKVKISATDNGYLPGFKIGDILITNEILGAENDTWTEFKLAYQPDGTYIVLVDGVDVAMGTAASLSSITFNGLDETGAPTSSEFKTATSPYGYHTIAFDDMVIYHTDDIDAPAPEAVTQTPGVVATPTPTPVPEAAPAAVLPEKAITVFEQNFDAEADVSYSLGTEGTDVAMGDIRVTIGGRSSGPDTSTYASVKENVEGDKILTTHNGRFGNSGRDVKVLLNNNVNAAELGEDGFAVLAFAAKLTPTETVPSVINFRKSGTADIITTLTTDENATAGLIVPANKWFLVEYKMYSDGEIYVTIDGTEYPLSVKATLLPDISTHDGSATEANTSVDFDNFVAYAVSDTYVFSTPTPEPTVPPVEAYEGSIVAFTQDMGELDPSYRVGLATESGTYTDIAGLTYSIGGRSEGISGDSTNVRVVTDPYENQYLYVETSRFGTNGRAPIFSVTGAPVLEQLGTDEDYVGVSFAAKLIPYGDTPATLAFPAVTDYSTNGGYYIYNAGTITTDENTTTGYYVPANEWFVVDVTVYKTGEYYIAVDGVDVFTGTTVNSGADGSSDKVSLTGLPYITTNAANKEATNASFAIDNVVAYYTGELSDVVVPDPTPAPVSAPGVKADDNTTVVFAETFNGLEDSFTRMGEESAKVAVGENITAVLGGRTGESSSEPQYTAVSVKTNVEGDKVMNLTGGKFGTATRAAKVAVNSPDVTTLEGEDDYIAMGFAFKLNPVSNVTDQISAITLVANADDVAAVEGNTETKDDGNVYGYSLVTITTNEADAGEKVKVVTAGEWYTARVYIYKDYWYVYIGNEEIASGATVNYSNSDKISLTKLPQIVAAKNVKTVATYPNVDIDNMIVYTSEVPTLADVAITAATAEAATITASEATTAKVVVASYADGRMVSATTQTVKLEAGENTVEIAAAAGDKVMAWTAYNNQGMQPFCAAATVQ